MNYFLFYTYYNIAHIVSTVNSRVLIFYEKIVKPGSSLILRASQHYFEFLITFP